VAGGRHPEGRQVCMVAGWYLWGRGTPSQAGMGHRGGRKGIQIKDSQDWDSPSSQGPQETEIHPEEETDTGEE